MRVVSHGEASSLLEFGVEISQDGQLRQQFAVRSRIHLDLPTKPYRVPWLAKKLNELALQGGSREVLLWIDEWGIWNEEIDAIGVDLFKRLRKTFGSDSRLAESSGQIFQASEIDGAVAFTLFPILFSWDAYLISSSGRLSIFFSHDEFIRLDILSPSLENELMDDLQDWSPKLMDA